MSPRTNQDLNSGIQSEAVVDTKKLRGCRANCVVCDCTDQDTIRAYVLPDLGEAQGMIRAVLVSDALPDTRRRTSEDHNWNAPLPLSH